MPTEPSSKSHLCNWSTFSNIYASLDAIEMRQNLPVTGGLLDDFQDGRRRPVCISMV